MEENFQISSNTPLARKVQSCVKKTKKQTKHCHDVLPQFVEAWSSWSDFGYNEQLNFYVGNEQRVSKIKNRNDTCIYM